MNDRCPLCKRELGNIWDRHHLVPRTFGGKEVVNIHRICHNKIHSVFTEKELAQYYNTIERLLESEQIVRFVKWIEKKHPDYYEKTKDTNERKRKRRR